MKTFYDVCVLKVARKSKSESFGFASKIFFKWGWGDGSVGKGLALQA